MARERGRRREGERNGDEESEDSEILERSLFLTVLFYLNDDFDGGQTRFLTSTPPSRSLLPSLSLLSSPHTDVNPVVGRVVIFDTCLLHQSLPHSRGVKSILKFSVYYSRECESHSSEEKTPLSSSPSPLTSFFPSLMSLTLSPSPFPSSHSSYSTTSSSSSSSSSLHPSSSSLSSEIPTLIQSLTSCLFSSCLGTTPSTSPLSKEELRQQYFALVNPKSERTLVTSREFCDLVVNNDMSVFSAKEQREAFFTLTYGLSSATDTHDILLHFRAFQMLPFLHRFLSLSLSLTGTLRILKASLIPQNGTLHVIG